MIKEKGENIYNRREYQKKGGGRGDVKMIMIERKKKSGERAIDAYIHRIRLRATNSCRHKNIKIFSNKILFSFTPNEFFIKNNNFSIYPITITKN